jgi:hypothetical protein
MSSKGGALTDGLRSGSKAFAEDGSGADAGLLPNRMPGSNSLMRPRSQQFPAGGSTDSERCALRIGDPAT